MNTELLATVRASLENIAPKGEELVTSFYDRVFSTYPELRSLFPADMAAQRQKLLATLILAVNALAAGQDLEEELIALGRRHAGYGVKNEDYGKIAESLLRALQAASGPTWTKGLETAWSACLESVSTSMLKGH